MSYERYAKNTTGVMFDITIQRTDDDTGIQLDSATDQKMIFKKPDGTIVKKDAQVVDGGGTNADHATYTVNSEDFLDQTGAWLVWVGWTNSDLEKRESYDRTVFWVV